MAEPGLARELTPEGFPATRVFSAIVGLGIIAAFTVSGVLACRSEAAGLDGS